MILALDMGGTKLAAALLEHGRVLERRQMPTPADRSPEAVVRAMLELLRPLLPKAKALGVAATGSVREGRVTAPNQQTLPWKDVDLQRMLLEATALPTFVLNDADAAAWGEAQYGAGRGVKNFLFVTVSTGVGSGLILQGNLLEGSELGFTRLENGGFLEHAASGTALDQWAKSQGWQGAADVMSRIDSNPEAAEVLDQSVRALAYKLEDLRVVLSLERVVIGGGLGLAVGYIERLRGFVGLEVLPAALGVDAGLVGAADWASRRLDAFMADTNVG